MLTSVSTIDFSGVVLLLHKGLRAGEWVYICGSGLVFGALEVELQGVFLRVFFRVAFDA